jgi:hypothetical protein
MVRSSMLLIFFAFTDLLLTIRYKDSSNVTPGLSREEPPTANTGIGSKRAAVSRIASILFDGFGLN